MNHPELLLLGVLRALAELAMLSLLAQGLLALMTGARRVTNPVYQVFRIVTRPVLAAVRRVTPPQVLDRHLPFVAFFVMFWLWIGLAWLRRAYCLNYGLPC